MRAFLHRLTLVLFAAALALRLLIAPGMMPVASAHGVRLAECAGQMDGKRGDPVKPACPFAAVAAPAVAPATPTLAWKPLRPVAPAVPVLALSVGAHGMPADRPPSTGPPPFA